MLVLGIESSCDETAAAVVEDGTRVLSSEVASQAAVHRPYGGVVPELACRNHVRAIVPVVRAALENAGLGDRAPDAVAATQGPGLVGALLVGFSFAKSYAHAKGIPWAGVNHLMGHIHAVFLAPDPPEFPFTALVASGGHTAVYTVVSHLETRCLGQTLDDAAGEAYDKVAKVLGLGYPGGQVIDTLARQGDPGKIPFPRIWLDRDAYDFSFSGIKTAVARHVARNPDTFREETADIAAGFQAAVVEVLAEKTVRAARETGTGRIVLVGGVAANSGLRAAVAARGERMGIRVWAPPVALCGDNAAMIAAAGYHRLAAGERDGLALDVFSKIPDKGVAGLGGRM
jgi:N6-L-threonylcarbamoyladenine synthase